MDISTAPKPFVLVLMPFGDEFGDVYELGIKQACIDAGAICERIDEQIFHGSILERIFSEIARATIVVSDMTGRNPNVFYETGYAHALNKHVILLTQRADDIPFDLKHFPHVVYQGKIAHLKRELQRRVEWFLENPKSIGTSSTAELRVHINSIQLAETVTSEIMHRAISTHVYEEEVFLEDLRISVLNPTAHVLEPNLVCIALMVDGGADCSIFFQKDEEDKLIGPATLLPNGQKLWNLLCPIRLYPEAWYTWRFGLRIPIKNFTNSGIRVQVVFYSPFGTRKENAVLRSEKVIIEADKGDA